MRCLDEMVEDIENIYMRYQKKNRGTEYVFARLWEEYYDENLEEEMLIYNLIIAKKNILERIVTKNNWKCISGILRNYEKNEKRVNSFLEVRDSIEVNKMYCEIKKEKIKRQEL